MWLIVSTKNPGKRRTRAEPFDQTKNFSPLPPSPPHFLFAMENCFPTTLQNFECDWQKGGIHGWSIRSSFRNFMFSWNLLLFTLLASNRSLMNNMKYFFNFQESLTWLTDSIDWSKSPSDTSVLLLKGDVKWQPPPFVPFWEKGVPHTCRELRTYA